MIRELAMKLGLYAPLSQLRNFARLSVQFGQYKSMWRWSCVDRAGNPIPWYTYPATEYLKQLDLSDKTVFEYGSGNSTLFWAARARKVVSIENDRTWFDKIRTQAPSNVEYILRDEEAAYLDAIDAYPHSFDIIVIDGSYRFECAKKALCKLSKGGFIILDNSDWMEDTTELLRAADLIEVDMSGFGPINGYTWTTSFFLSRDVQLRPAQKRQPQHSIGSVPHVNRDRVR